MSGDSRGSTDSRCTMSCSGQDEVRTDEEPNTSTPDHPDPQELMMQTLLEQLKPWKSNESYRALSEVVNDYKGKTFEESRRLIEFLTCELKDYEDKNPKSGIRSYFPDISLPSLFKSSSESQCSFGKGKLLKIVAGETFGVHNVILQQAMTKSSKFQFTADPQGCDSVIVFCPIMFRIASDVDAGMRSIPESARAKPVILVLMHYTRDANHTIDEAPWSDLYPYVMYTVNVLYHETTSGLLECRRNNQAIKLLRNILLGP